MSKPRILIVEDNMAVQRTLCRILQSLDVEIVTAESLAQVVAILDDDPQFAVCLLDYCLPDAMDGETLPIVLHEQIPTIVLTGRNDTETREKVMLNSVVDYIPKDNPAALGYARKMVMRVLKNPAIKVLVVDDSPSIRRYLNMLLQRQLYQVLEAGNANEALALLREHSDIRLVLMDYDMPGMTGVETCGEIRRFRSTEDLVIIGISASQDPHMSARFLKAGADDFLHKPFNHEEFFCRITRNVEFVENLRALVRAAREDPLTGLCNRRHFFEQTQWLDESYGLAMIDIDFFKQINDKYGHAAGDDALRFISNALREAFKDDLTARMGGEEFVVVIKPDACIDNLKRLENFRKTLASSTFSAANEFTLQFTVSIGYANSASRDINQVIKCADDALYRAKTTGRNRICFDPQINIPQPD